MKSGIAQGQTSFGSNNLAVIVAAASASNTTVSIVEINKSTASQSAIQTISIPGTGANAIRVSGSATSTLYASNSDDGTLLCFTGANSTNTASNANTLNPRAVVTLNNAGAVSIATTYTGGSGNQTRGATSLNNTNWYVGDQGGFYTNGSTSASPAGNIRSVRAFGGTVYGLTSATTIPPVGIISATTGGTYTALTGLANGAGSRQDFYMISSGNNGSTYDILYVLDATSATAGTIFKYSLVSGFWTANGSYTTAFGGFGLLSEKSSTGANLYVTTGTGATTANTVKKIFDAAGYNATINITTANIVNLYTAATGTILKGLAFAPSATSYTVTFDANGGTGSMSNQSASAATNLTSNSFSRTGYSFSGWNTSSNGSGTSYANSASYPFTSNTTLYAQWTANNLAVTYDSQGGSAISSGSTTTGGTISTSPGTPTKTGYTFNGWFTAASGGSAITFPYTHGQTANFTLYAQWTANTLTVSYDSQGGSAITNGSTTTGGTVSNPGNPTQAGYTFNGWFTASTGGTAISFPYTHNQTADFSLYAQWTAASTPTLDASVLSQSLSTTYGTASTDVGFTASGSNLTEAITAIAQSGYEVSTDNTSYSSSVSVSSGATVYVRFTATQAAGTYNGATAVVLSSTGATNANISTSSSGNIVSTKSITISSISISDKVYDGNTTATIAGTAAYSGLVNGESFSITGTPSAVFNDKNVGVGKPITISGYTTPSANYTLAQPTGLQANITAATLTVTSAAVTSKTYDGTTSATVTGTLSGVISGDAVTLTGTGTFASANVGTGISVTSTSTLGGADAGNYTLTQPTGLTGDITQGTQTITFNALTPATLATADFSPGATASSGLTVSYTSSNPCVATIVGGNIHIVGVGSTVITASQSGEGSYAAASSVNQTLVVMSPTSTLTAGDIAIIAYNTSGAPDNFAILFNVDVAQGTTFYINDNEMATSSSTSFADLNEFEASFTVKSGQTIPAGTVIVLPWGAAAVSAPQYDWSSTSPGAGLGNNNEELYIYTASSITATTPTAFIYYAKIGGSTSAVPSSLSLGTTAIAPSGNSLRYATTGATYSGTKATLLAAIGNTASNWNTTGATTFAASDWTFSVTPSPIINTSGTLAAVNTTYGTASTPTTSFTVTASNLTADLTLTAPSGYEISTGSTYSTTLTISPNSCGAISTTTIYVRLAATTPVGTYSGNIVLTSTGATSVNVATVSSTVSAKPLTIINLTASDKVYDALTTVTVNGTPAYSGLANGETFSVTGTVSWAFPDPNVENNKILTRTGDYSAPSANYTVTQPSLTASITLQALTITANNVTKPNGATLSGGSGSTAFTSSGLQNGETIGSVTIAYGSGAAASDLPGTYVGQVTPSSATGGTFTAANYSITYISGNIIISETPTLDALTLLTPLTTTYGSVSTGISFTASGSNLTGAITATAQSGYEVSTDNTSYSSSVSVSSGATVYVRFTATQAAGTYNSATAVVLSSTGATNANISTSSSGNIVSTKSITISGISISDKVYDGNTTATIIGTAAYSGLVNGESFSVTGTPSAVFNDKNVGTGKPVTVSGYTAPSANYTLTQPTGLQANITAATLTVTGAAVTSKPYDGTTSATVTGTLSGVISGDAVTLTGSGIFASANVGTGISVTSTSTLGGADAGNYTLTQPTGLLGTITAKPLTITATDVTKGAGVQLTGGSGSTAFTSIGLAGSETIGSVTITYGSAAGTTGQGATPGTYLGQTTPSAATGGTFNAANYTITYISGSIIVTGFTPGNLVVNKLGNGTAALGSTATAINVVELTTGGTTQQTLSNLFTGSNLLTESGTATSNGYLNSYNTQLGVPGYNTALTTTGVASLNTKATNILGTLATISSRTLFPTGGPAGTPPSPYSGNNFRSVVPTSSTTFYASGTSSGSPNTGGVYYYNGAAFTQISTTITNTRNVDVFNGNLYFSTGSAPAGIYLVGTGLPTTSGQTSVLIASSGSPYGFSISPDGNTMYVADDAAINANSGGGIQKWTKSGSTWTRQYTFAVQARGITVDYSNTNAIIYATTIETNSNKIIKITDSGSSATASDVTSAGTNYVFRGVDFSPAAAPSAPAIGTVTQPTCAAATGSVELTGLPDGQWRIYGFPSGGAVGTGSTTTISGLVAGNYTFIVTSYTGRTSSSSTSVTINAQPGAPGYPVAPSAANQNFCANVSPSVANLATTSGSNIQWYSASTGGTALLSADLLTNGNYYATQNVNGCESQSRTLAAVTLTNITTTTTPNSGDVVWHGTTSTDWNTASNWSNYNGTAYSLSTTVPSQLTNVIVPANQTCVLTQPSVLAATTNAAKNVVIETNAALTLSGGTLSIAGDWSNNGTFTGSTGTVSFNGSGAATLGGTSSTSFANLSLDKNGSVSLAVPVTVSASLALNNGIIELGANTLSLGAATVTGGSATSYVKTASTGTVSRNVGASATTFPVGNSAYNPAVLTNNGTSDVFSVRVIDNVTANGTGVGTTTSLAVVNRTWMISEATTGGSNASVRLYWNGAGEEVNGFSAASAYVAHYSTTGSMWENMGGSVGADYVQSTDAITNFSPFTISSTNTFAPLPVELLSFDAQCADQDVIVRWTTASEHNSLNFSVQRSEDGKTWADVQTVAAAGYSTTVLDYAIEDLGAARGVKYYRLIQTDQDGIQKIYGPILTNCASEEIGFITYPNPSTGDFTLQFNAKNVQGDVVMHVADATGKIVRSVQLNIEHGTQSVFIPSLDLCPGIYHIQLLGDHFQTGVFKHSLR
jgi:uncharacterized repeat protein (TIGR02543 family)